MTTQEDTQSCLSQLQDTRSALSKASQPTKLSKLSKVSFNSQYSRFPTRDIVAQVREKYRHPTSLFGSEPEPPRKPRTQDINQKHNPNRAQQFPKPAFPKKPLPETSMWGTRQKQEKAAIKVLDSENLKSSVFEVQNRPVSPPKLAPKYFPSTAFEFVTNPEKTAPFEEMVELENNVIHHDGRYSEINLKNRNFAE